MLTSETPFLKRFRSSLRVPSTLFIIFGISFMVCFLLSTREAKPPPNDGIINLPVEGFSSEFLGLYGEALIGADPTAPISELAAAGGWQKLNTRYVGFGAISEPIWLRAKLRNTSADPITVRFDTRRVAFKEMQLYLTQDQGQTVTQFLDYAYEAPFSERPVNHRILVADAVLAPNEETELYVHYQGLYNSVLPMRLSTPEAFERADKYELFWASLFYGLITAAFFLTVLTWWLTGWRLSVSFGIFLLASIFSVWSVEGYVDQLLIPTKTPITARLTDTIYLWTYGAILLISRNIFDLKTKAPLLDRINIWAIIVIFVISFLHLFIGIEGRGVFVPIALTCRVFSVALHAVVGIWAIINREKGGTIFTLSAVSLTMASAYMVYDETFGFPFGGIPFTLRWLVTIETLAFATAIVQNVASVKKERDQALIADLRATKEKLRLNEALRESQSAYELARLKASDYQNRLQTVSHDILQPLNSLQAMLSNSVASNSAESKHLSEAFAYLKSLATENLPQLRDRYATEVSKPEEVPLSLIVQTVYGMFKSDAEAKGLDFTQEGEIPADVLVNPILAMRALSNLIANAIHYTQRGSVIISSSFSNGAAEVVISDTGSGLSQDEINSYLKHGVSGAHSTGSGLGLSITQTSMNELGGSFEFASVLGKGTKAVCRFTKSHETMT